MEEKTQMTKEEQEVQKLRERMIDDIKKGKKIFEYGAMTAGALLSLTGVGMAPTVLLSVAFGGEILSGAGFVGYTGLAKKAVKEIGEKGIIGLAKTASHFGKEEATSRGTGEILHGIEEASKKAGINLKGIADDMASLTLFSLAVDQNTVNAKKANSERFNEINKMMNGGNVNRQEQEKIFGKDFVEKALNEGAKGTLMRVSIKTKIPGFEAPQLEEHKKIISYISDYSIALEAARKTEKQFGNNVKIIVHTDEKKFEKGEYNILIVSKDKNVDLEKVKSEYLANIQKTSEEINNMTQADCEKAGLQNSPSITVQTMVKLAEKIEMKASEKGVEMIGSQGKIQNASMHLDRLSNVLSQKGKIQQALINVETATQNLQQGTTVNIGDDIAEMKISQGKIQNTSINVETTTQKNPQQATANKEDNKKQKTKSLKEGKQQVKVNTGDNITTRSSISKEVKPETIVNIGLVMEKDKQEAIKIIEKSKNEFKQYQREASVILKTAIENSKSINDLPKAIDNAFNSYLEKNPKAKNYEEALRKSIVDLLDQSAKNIEKQKEMQQQKMQTAERQKLKQT